MNQNQIDISSKVFYNDDNETISKHKKSKKVEHERKRRRSKSFNSKNIDKSIKNIRRQLSGEKENDQNEIDDNTSQSSTVQDKFKLDKHSLTKLSSHSSNNLIKIEDVKNQSDDESRNKSDTECEKMVKKINVNNNSDIEKEADKETEIETETDKEKKENEEINKNDNINFNNNIKRIFNNIGNINYHNFENEKEKEKEKDNETKDSNELVLEYYKKQEVIIRKVYYSQLLLKKIWKPINDAKRHNSLIIFDWDDTLLPTSFLTPRGIFDDKNELNEKDQAKISKLEESVKTLLTLAVSRGDVYIITNAGEGWVEFSCGKYYPSIVEILKKIKVISARGVYEEKYPGDSKRWKVESFLNIKKRLNDELITNIICLGDSVFEMEAGRILASKFIHAVIKTIKFRENPKPEELNKQLSLVINQFSSIYTSSKNLTVRVEKKKK